MSKLFSVGKIVVGGLLEARKDGHIDSSEVLSIFNRCADEVGLRIHFNREDADDMPQTEAKSPVERVDKDLHEQATKDLERYRANKP
ncbi:MAG: hypothetical protein ABW121_18990 [Candidatus Thiodiazotropha sp. 6PLUC7]